MLRGKFKIQTIVSIQGKAISRAIKVASSVENYKCILAS